MGLNGFEKNMMAAAFAEGGDFRSAREIAGGGAGMKATWPGKAANGVKACLWGVVSAGFLAAMFMNENMVTDLYTRGKWAAAFPIATVFVYSFIHGSFSNYLLAFFGLEAKKKK